MSPTATHFLALDVDLESQSDLSSLAMGFGDGAFVIATDFRDGVNRITFELMGEPLDAEAAILRFISLLETLPPPAVEVWKGADRRSFNLGVQAGATHSYELPFSSETLRRTADWGARLVMTVYGVEHG